jgi:alkylated DNA repair dioxygenase AlkB
MDLFHPTNLQNLLAYDGCVSNHGFLFNKERSKNYFDALVEQVPWKADELIMFGKRVVTKRKIGWYGDLPFKYSYGNTVKKAAIWTPTLFEIKKSVESKTGVNFNSCLLNLYHDGNEGMSWHQDNEKELGENPIIASLSLGASRKFSFKHIKTKARLDLILESGSLILMKDETQKYWQHSLPKSKKIKQPRINLTFRNIYTDHRFLE